MINLRTLPLFFLTILFFCETAHSAEIFAGDWAGAFQLRDAIWSDFLIHLKSTDNGLAGTTDMLQNFIMDHQLDAVITQANAVRFELNEKDIHLSFAGKLENNAIIGQVRRNGQESAFRLDRVVKTNPDRFAGTYQLAPDHYIVITPVHITFEGVRLLTSFDLQSGQLQPLFPRSDTTFFTGPSYGAGPAENSLAFTVDAQHQTTLKWTPHQGDSLTGHAVSVREEKFSFKNGNVTLAGSLLLPFTPGPHPAVVFVHGSGPSSRNDYRLHASYFAANGVASLIFDKRGVGESTGNWVTAGFDEFAGDALAGIAQLKTRADIQPQKIGLCGMSQAGWIMPLAASRSADVAFVISLSGAGVSPEEQGAYMVEHRMRSEGFADADVAKALTLYHLNSRCAKTDTGWDELDAAVAQARKQPWFHPEFIPQNPASAQQWRSICDYDPIATLHKVRCPVLAILGGVDPLVPAQKSAAAWKTALAEAGNPDATIQILPYADHGLADPALGLQHPEFFTIQRDWLIRHTRDSR
ncbi:MAG TPA: alpha/beta fold hydrolase [Tepidisphaeraceae bacterium]|jgi:pimeloyl-ACP methyl ester carboxylesterase|nr:alpha/beta fold hydrolase [Tepidisphaeraceae bacterium]